MDSTVNTGTVSSAQTKDSPPYSITTAKINISVENMVYAKPKVGSNGDPLTATPKNFVELTNAICFRLHQFTTADLLTYGIRFITILLFASIILPCSLFQILLFILIILLAIIYIVGKPVSYTHLL